VAPAPFLPSGYAYSPASYSVIFTFPSTELVRPTSEHLVTVLREALGRDVAHIVWPPWAAVDIYFLPDSELVDIRELHKLGEALAGERPVRSFMAVPLRFEAADRRHLRGHPARSARLGRALIAELQSAPCRWCHVVKGSLSE
jgi:hypothetical protein